MRWLLPPVFVAISVILMVLHALLSTASGILSFPYNYLGLVPAVGGLGIVVSGVRQFTRESTNISTFHDPDKLVTDGLFKHSRNPIYAGFLFLLSGVAIFLNSHYYLVFPLLFFLAANHWYIPFEERRLAEIFGAYYTDYKNKVRRWI